jgi:hypothetical protein
MAQDIITLFMVIAAGTYSLIQVCKLFRKPKKGKMQMICPAGCISCKPGKNHPGTV